MYDSLHGSIYASDQAEKERNERANRSKMQKLRKKVPKEKKRQSLLQLAVQISLLDSEKKKQLDFLLDRLNKESISSIDCS